LSKLNLAAERELEQKGYARRGTATRREWQQKESCNEKGTATKKELQQKALLARIICNHATY
jgi:hypothetical protein